MIAFVDGHGEELIIQRALPRCEILGHRDEWRIAGQDLVIVCVDDEEWRRDLVKRCRIHHARWLVALREPVELEDVDGPIISRPFTGAWLARTVRGILDPRRLIR